MKRSPRHGWSLVELRDGRWHLATTGDREQLKGVFSARVSTMLGALGDGLSIRQRYAGKAVALYDARARRRDEYPTLPRLADETRIVYPATVPGAEGADVTLWQPREARP
jgi:hypothetical protein